MARIKLIVGIIIIALLTPALACHLTSQQRVSSLNRAVQLLTAKERRGATTSPATSELEVVTHRYFNNYQNRWAVVRRVKVVDTRSFDLSEDERNVGQYNDFVVRANKVKVGTYFRVVVVWDDGQTYNWEHRAEPHKTRIEVWKPN